MAKKKVYTAADAPAGLTPRQVAAWVSRVNRTGLQGGAALIRAWGKAVGKDPGGTPGTPPVYVPKEKVEVSPGITKETANIINEQQDINQSTAQRNDLSSNANQYGDFGQTTYTRDPATGRIVQSAQSTGANQAALQGGQQLHSSALGYANNLLGAGDPLASKGLTDMQAAIYNNLSRNYETQYQQQKEQLQAQLTNSGNGPGTPLWQNQMNNFEDQAQKQRDQMQSSALQQATGMLTNQIGNVGAASNLGIGYQAPTSNQFNAITQTAPNAADVAFQQTTGANQATTAGAAVTAAQAEMAKAEAAKIAAKAPKVGA